MGDKPGVNSRPREKVAAEAADTERLGGINSVWEPLQQHGRGLEEVLIERGKAGPRLQQIIDLVDLPELKFAPFEPAVPAVLQRRPLA